jgi:phosphatidylserine/phosphatidylglycerophosphate/cardiolipin synthase-like enzyme
MRDGAADAPAPPRALITAEEAFPRFEKLALSARRELCMSFRIFDPATRLRSDAARDLGLATWCDLIWHVSRAGVKTRLLIADFDPVFATDLHVAAWCAADGFRDESGPAILLHRHPARVGKLWRLLLNHKFRARLRELTDDGRIEATPAVVACAQGFGRFDPGSLHQKLAVADGERMIIGGLDIDERRFDTLAHDRPSEQTWHDVSVEIEGPMAAHGHRHFAKSWNIALQSREEYDPPLEDRDPMPVPDRPAPVPGQTFLRTISRPRRGLFRFGPKTRHAEHEEASVALFLSARKHVYIETQFFRHRPLAEALAEAARRAPQLNCIVMLPVGPERVIFGGDDGIDARHAQALQMACIDILKGAFGDRLALVSPAQPRAGNGGVTYRGSDIVYVHAKVTSVDDRSTIIGSANLNGRSMRWDTEASVQLDDPDFARDLRLRLARKWLGELGDDEDPALAATWRAHASANADARPEDRHDFVMPFPEDKNRKFSFYAPFLPNAMF